MSQYLDNLNSLIVSGDYKLSDVGDQWRTPDIIHDGIEEYLLGDNKFPVDSEFKIDLFTDGMNSKCDKFYTAQVNALTQNWADDLRYGPGKHDYGWAFGNPPYSRGFVDADGEPITGMEPIIEKCFIERAKGAKIALLVKAATSENWWPDYGADLTLFIKGRIKFELPHWFDESKGKPTSSGFGAAVLVFNSEYRGGAVEYISRKELEDLGRERFESRIEKRKKWLENFL